MAARMRVNVRVFIQNVSRSTTRSEAWCLSIVYKGPRFRFRYRIRGAGHRREQRVRDEK